MRKDYSITSDSVATLNCIRQAICCIVVLMVAGIIQVSFAQTNEIKGLPFIQNYDKEEYLAGIQNWAITQDRNGILYVANNLGLLEFDGTEWRRYPVGNSSKVRSIHIDKSGKIYVGNQVDFGYFFPNAQGQITYTSLADSLPASFRNFDEAWKIYEFDDALYFCTFKNIYEYRNNEFNVITSSYNLEISFLVDNQLFVQEWLRGLSVLSNNQLELIPGGSFFRNKRISGIIPLERGKLLISTFENGLYTYESGEVSEFEIRGQVDLPKAIINCVLRLRDGQIAIGTQNQGLLIIDKSGNLKQHLDKSTGLIDRTVNSVYQDYNANLWLGLNFGISRVELNSPFTLIDERLGISGAGYAAFMDKEQIYLGTNNGLFTVSNTHSNSLQFKEGTQFVEGSEGQVYSVGKHNGQLLLGHHNGAFTIEQNNVRQINNEKGAWLFAEIPNHPGYFIQGSYLGLNLYKAKGNQLLIQHKISGFSESSRVLGFDEDNNLWVTQGYKGAYKLKLSDDLKKFDKVEYYNERSGFPSNVFINVFDINNQLVFSSEFGFYSYNQEKNVFAPNTTFNNLIGNKSSLSAMKEDEMGNVYFIERSKVGKLTPTNFDNYDVESSLFNKIKDRLNDDLGNINILDYRNILFGGSQGFIHYDPMFRFETSPKFKVLLRTVQDAGDEDSIYFDGVYVEQGKLQEIQPASQQLSLPFARNSIKFRFAGIHYESEDKINYQYKLENFDSEWSGWTDSSEKEYTNLREGDYTFLVKARNVYGEESEIIGYRFSITPPFYRSNLAYAIYIILGITSLFAGFKVLDKKYKREKLKLAEEKELALEEKDSEILTITQESEEEIIKLRNDKLRAEIEHKNNELTSSAMHLIQKNQLLNNIKNTLTNLSKEKESQNMSGALNRIVKSITQDLSNEEDWKTFELNFDKVHGNFITRLKEKYPGLTPQELKLSAYLRMNLNTKEMANLLNISVRGVEIGRYRVRKKLELQRSENLTDFILRF